MLEKNIVLESKLEVTDLIKRLNTVTEKKYTKESNTFKFEGEVLQDKFRILPTSDYSQNDRIRPEILGEITKIENQDLSLINLKFRLAPNHKIFFIFILIFNFIVMLLLSLFSDFSLDLKLKFCGLVLLAIIIFSVIAFFTFRIRAVRSLDILKRVFKARE